MGDLPGWVTIGVSTAALAVSVITLWMHLTDRRRADASVVDAYFDAEAGSVIVRNSGSRAVYDIRVQLISTGTVTPLQARRVHRIGPGTSQTFALGAATIQGGHLTGPPLLIVRAEFTDESGRRWRRTSDGRLRRARLWNQLPVQ